METWKKNILRYLSIIIAAGIGYWIWGYYGLIFGFSGSWIFDRLRLDEGGGNFFERIPNTEEVDAKDFIVACILLGSAVVKADGKIEELEMIYIRRFLSEQFGDEMTDNYEPVLQKALNNEFDWHKATVKIRKINSYESRLHLLYFLYGIAAADYEIGRQEGRMIEKIAMYLGLPRKDRESIRAMFEDDVDSHYRVLEVLPSVSDQGLKEAYQNMCQKYHPDKLEHLGAIFVQAGTEKFQRIDSAYKAICKQRGIKV